MWKYMDKEKSKEFLLSLHLTEQHLMAEESIKKLYTISNTIEKNYTVFQISKRNGKTRTIEEPHYTLKQIQRKILKNILNNKAISSYAKAYQLGTNLKDNALPHLRKETILKLDIKDFFHQIRFYDIYQACFPLEYFPESIGILLTTLCTYQDHLPQGAPTSAAISNLVMKDFDEEIGNWCQEQNIAYTRYSDDMTFSGILNPSKIIQKVKKELYPLGLHLNQEKIHVIDHSQRQSVTGIVVNEKIQLEQNYRKKIRQEIYYIQKYGLSSHLKRINNQEAESKYLNQLYGKVSYVLQINQHDQEFQSYLDYLNKIKR